VDSFLGIIQGTWDLLFLLCVNHSIFVNVILIELSE